VHHSDRETDRMRELVRQLQLGPTGQFPQGQLNPVDEGEIKLAIGVEDGKVVLNFGKPVAWIGFDWQQALALAESIRQKAHQVRKGE
jgi:hypothetical protein